MNKRSRLATIAALAATVHLAALPVVAQNAAPPGIAGLTESQIQQVINDLNAKLRSLGVQGQVTGATRDGTNTVFQLKPDAGISADTLQQQLVDKQKSISGNEIPGTPYNSIVVPDAAVAAKTGVSLLLAPGCFGGRTLGRSHRRHRR